MNIFPKKSTKKLNLNEMWQVYRSLQTGLVGRSEEYLLPEILKILDSVSTDNFRQVLSVMSIPESKDSLGVTVAFVRSVKVNQLFAFKQFIAGIHGSRN